MDCVGILFIERMEAEERKIVSRMAIEIGHICQKRPETKMKKNLRIENMNEYFLSRPSVSHEHHSTYVILNLILTQQATS